MQPGSCHSFCIKVEKNLRRWKFLQHTSASRNVLNTEGTDSIVRLMLVRNTSSPGVEIADWCASSGNFLEARGETIRQKYNSILFYCYCAQCRCQGLHINATVAPLAETPLNYLDIFTWILREYAWAGASTSAPALCQYSPTLAIVLVPLSLYFYNL